MSGRPSYRASPRAAAGAPKPTPGTPRSSVYTTAARLEDVSAVATASQRLRISRHLTTAQSTPTPSSRRKIDRCVDIWFNGDSPRLSVSKLRLSFPPMDDQTERALSTPYVHFINWITHSVFFLTGDGLFITDIARSTPRTSGRGKSILPSCVPIVMFGVLMFGLLCSVLFVRTAI